MKYFGLQTLLEHYDWYLRPSRLPMWLTCKDGHRLSPCPRPTLRIFFLRATTACSL